MHGGNKELDEILKQIAECKFSEYYGHELFSDLFAGDEHYDGKRMKKVKHLK